jgi:hypothetical protein
VVEGAEAVVYAGFQGVVAADAKAGEGDVCGGDA